MKGKILITGSTGMVGNEFIQYLISSNTDLEIYGTYKSQMPFLEKDELNYIKIDLNDFDAVSQLVETVQPNYILHLAAQSSVGVSWQKPFETIQNNFNCFLNILEATRLHSNKTKILLISSAEVYQTSKEKLKETDFINAQNPYSLSRKIQEEIAQLYIQNYQSNIVISRSFNHIGIHQNKNFFIPSIIHQIAKAKNEGLKSMQLNVGNINIVRDFMDVNDVVKIYFQLLIKGNVGEVYNVCSGTPTSLKNIIHYLSEISEINIEINVCEDRIRANENEYLVGDNSKLKTIIEDFHLMDIKTTIRAIFNYYMKTFSTN